MVYEEDEVMSCMNESRKKIIEENYLKNVEAIKFEFL